METTAPTVAPTAPPQKLTPDLISAARVAAPPTPLAAALEAESPRNRTTCWALAAAAAAPPSRSAGARKDEAAAADTMTGDDAEVMTGRATLYSTGAHTAPSMVTAAGILRLRGGVAVSAGGGSSAIGCQTASSISSARTASVPKSTRALMLPVGSSTAVALSAALSGRVLNEDRCFFVPRSVRGGDPGQTWTEDENSSSSSPLTCADLMDELDVCRE